MEIMAQTMAVQKYRRSSHKALPQLEVTLTSKQYCKCSITKAGLVSKNEVNFLPLPQQRSIVLPHKSTTGSRQMMSHATTLYYAEVNHQLITMSSLFWSPFCLGQKIVTVPVYYNAKGKSRHIKCWFIQNCMALFSIKMCSDEPITKFLHQNNSCCLCKRCIFTLL